MKNMAVFFSLTAITTYTKFDSHCKIFSLSLAVVYKLNRDFVTLILNTDIEKQYMKASSSGQDESVTIIFC